jgi:hypothetical protein
VRPDALTPSGWDRPSAERDGRGNFGLRLPVALRGGQLFGAPAAIQART